MNGFIIVDGNSLGHAHHRSTKLTVGNFETQAIFGFVKAIRNLKLAHPNRHMIVLWDGKAKFRYDLMPDYKANRKAMTAEEKVAKDAYKAQVPYIQGILAALGVDQRLNFDLEADDLAGYITPTLAAAKPVLLVTGDGDWLQMVGHNVTWHDPRYEGRTVTEENFFHYTGYHTPAAFLQGKALRGDSSDNISGVGGVGEVGAAELLAEWGSMGKFYAAVKDGSYVPKGKKLTKLATEESRDIFLRNLKLMNLLKAPKPDKAMEKSFPTNFNSEVVLKAFQKLSFISILKDFANFISVFDPKGAHGIK
jgi:5'-3' exonuclease